LLGILLAWIALSLISRAIDFPLYLPVEGALVGLLFSLVTGFVSGLYPALKAAAVDPIKAIYYFE
jgi:putative ABC transport system permease protein